MYSFETYAKIFHSLGLNITCITNYLTEFNFMEKNLLKAPHHSWQKFQSEKQDRQDLLEYDWINSIGLGTVLGFQNLRAIDIDGCNSLDFIYKVLEVLDLPLDYQWVMRSGSSNGFHILFYSSDDSLESELKIKTNENLFNHKVFALGPNKEYQNIFDHLEIRWTGHLVLPPSLHNSGQYYSFLFCNIPNHPPLELENYYGNSSLYSGDAYDKNGRKDKNLSMRYFVYNFCDLQNHYAPSGDNFFRFTPVKLKPKQSLSNITKQLKSKTNTPITIIFDLETNGLPVKNHNNPSLTIWPDILQISWVILSNTFQVLKKETFIIKDKSIRVLPEIEKLTSISNEIMDKIGFPIKDILIKYINDLKDCEVIVAHNFEFDSNVFLAECKRNGIDFIFPFKLIVYDTMVLGKTICKIDNGFSDLKFPKLSELYFYLFKENLNQHHNADLDVFITAKCFKQIMKNEGGYTNYRIKQMLSIMKD